MEKYRAALLQMDSGPDMEKNKEQVERLITEAAQRGATLALLPETWDYIGRDMAGHGKPIPGSASEFLREQAQKHGIYLLGGSCSEAAEDGKIYNTSLFYSPQGELLGKYQKTHLFDVDISGENTELGSVGMSVCYDLRFPELYRLQTLAGAKILAVAANFTHATGEAHWELLLRARAVENSCYVLACNQCGQKAAFRSYGNSMVISPWGEILARAGESPCCLTAEIDLEQVARVRRELPSLKNRREDLYRLTLRRAGTENR